MACTALTPDTAPAVNQISSPDGDQATPSVGAKLPQAWPRLFLWPSRSTTAMVPPVSPRAGWSTNATRSPSRETRTPLIQPVVS